MTDGAAKYSTHKDHGSRYSAVVGFLSKIFERTLVGSIDMFNPWPELIATTNAAVISPSYRSASITNVVEEAEHSRSFEFAFHDDQTPSITPGQFVPVRFRIGQSTHERCYAISSLVLRGDTPRFTVKRVAGGLVSNWCNEHLSAGTTIWIGQPAGLFKVRQNDSPIVFIAGGIGLAPIFPMLKEALLFGDRQVVLMIYDSEQRRVPFFDSLNELALQSGGRLRITETYVGSAGAVDAATIQRQLEPFVEASLYMCGPSAFMDMAETAGLAAGISHRRIFTNSQADISERRSN
ncbi:MAG TPA: FAD-binding oxidoreductase [Afipia sp.]